MIGSILLPVPAPLLSHRISLWNRHSRPGPRFSLSKQGQRFISTVIATDSDYLSATHRLLRKFVACLIFQTRRSKYFISPSISEYLSPTPLFSCPPLNLSIFFRNVAGKSLDSLCMCFDTMINCSI
ncbi:hypothetical protein RND71_003672 [Anisodus tanguticus]|uniref:Uncharacterized protein n=1 Tax=Anisodus tanguticus TaxID=243964 RepID=A0AAE1SZ18_9SOLA|nr:hypothetical protein RND71_003672 [Anisodus tanguticus]